MDNKSDKNNSSLEDAITKTLVDAIFQGAMGSLTKNQNKENQLDENKKNYLLPIVLMPDCSLLKN